MTDDLLANVLVPIASPEDAEATCDAALSRLARNGGRLTAVHVVEKADGAPDKASVEQREEYANAALAVVERRAAEAGVPVETRVVFDTDVTDAILDAAADVGASAIVFTPRSGSRWLDLLTGDVTRSLVKRTNRPVVVLPDEGDDETTTDE